MIKTTIFILVLSCSTIDLFAQDLTIPDTISISSGNLTLKGLLWRPKGDGPFPSIIFCHGSYGGDDTVHDPVKDISVLGPVFTRKGYLFFCPFRRGVGLSQGQGTSIGETMYKAFKQKGQEERNKTQLQQLETDQLQDMISGLLYLRGRRDVDTNRMAVVGHSFGGSLALLLAEHEPRLKAVVLFAAAGYSWDRSPPLRERLTRAVENITVPVMIIHAQNDYSTNPGYFLDSVLNRLDKPHLLKIYPKFGNSQTEGHRLVFLNTKTWEEDVFKFLGKTSGAN